MKSNIPSVLLIFLLANGLSISASGAGTIPNKIQEERQATALEDVQKAVAEATGYGADSITVTRASHLVTVTVIDSKLNDAHRMDREAEAQIIATAVEKSISGKPEFSQIGAIHVDYVKTKQAKKTLIQGIDFNKTAAGSFQIHKS